MVEVSMKQKVAIGVGIVLLILGIILLGVSSKYKQDTDVDKKKKKDLQIAGGVLLAIGVLGCGIVGWMMYRETKHDKEAEEVLAQKFEILPPIEHEIGKEEDDVFLRDCDAVMSYAPNKLRQSYTRARKDRQRKNANGC